MGIDLKNLKVNKPKANIEDYVFTVYGRPKAGKTSLFAKLVKRIYNDVSKGLLCGFEPGFRALNVLGQEINNWEEFIEIVDQLIEQKDELGIKFVGIDTADKANTMATEYIIQKKKIEDRKPYKVIGDIPFGGGYDLVDKEISRQLDRLVRAGYGLFITSHDTDKKFESRDGVSYDKTTCSLPNRARNTILNMSDFILFIDIAKEKDDSGKLVDKRFIHFRADGADLEAGSRFANVPNKIPYDVDEFIKTFEHAVLSEYGDDVDIDKVKKQQQVEKEVQVKQFIEQEKAEQEPEVTANEVIEEINQLIDAMKPITPEQKQQLTAIFTQHLNMTNYKKATDVAALQKCVVAINGM